MLGIPALLAGCRRVVLCSPPRSNGNVDPLVLAAAASIGIVEVYAVGGAQAIAALAYGTETMPKVDKIFGPGNKYVTAAKHIVSADPDGAAVDMFAGPSELLIVADDSADALLVAADLISQAEHDVDSRVALVTTSRSLADDVAGELDVLSQQLSRNTIAERALGAGFTLLVDTLDEAVDFTNEYAPEHLVINTRLSEALVPRIQSAGSLGPFSPVTAGDYASGTNHTLPTSATARRTSGLSVESFQKFITFQSLTERGLRQLSPTLFALAQAEGLEGHWKAVEVRTGPIQESP
jgi:histidinol dehydrogenase